MRHRPDVVGARDETADIHGEALGLALDGHGPIAVHVCDAPELFVERFSELIDGREDGARLVASPCADDACFNALDKGVEVLVAWMAGDAELGASMSEALAAEAFDVESLTRVFPRFARLPVFAEAASPAPKLPGRTGREPHEQRLRGFRALRRLLVLLGRERPIALHLRGLERADADSQALLEVLLADPINPEGTGEGAALLWVLDYATEKGADEPSEAEAVRESTPAWLAARRLADEGELIVLRGEGPASPAPGSESPATVALDDLVDAGFLALERLAFARGHDLLLAALERSASGREPSLSPSRRAEVLEGLALALVELGQRRRAARRKLDAAERHAALSKHERALALELEAAALLIADGRLADGWRVLEPLLVKLDVPIPGSSAEALLRANWRRGRLLMRRRELTAPGIREHASPQTRARLDALWFTSTRLAVVSRALSDALRTYHLDLVLRHGDESDRARALAYEVAVENHIGAPFDRTARRLYEACAELCERTQDGVDEAWRQTASASNEFCMGRWHRCAAACEAADARLEEHEGVAWERSMVASYHWFALAWMGEFNRLRPMLATAAALAETRDEPFNLLEVYAGQPVLMWLADGKGELARDRAQAALARVSAPPGTHWPVASYRRQHYCDLVAHTHASLYAGDPSGAWAALLHQWRELEMAYFVSMRTVGLELRFARARAAMGLVEARRRGQLDEARLHAQPGGAGWDPARWTDARLLADARKHIDTIAKDPIACFAPAMAKLLDASYVNLEGDRARARVLLDEAVRGFSAVDMRLHRECARLALGTLIGGQEGEDVQAQAQAWMDAQGVVDARRLAASQVVGFGL